MRPGWWLLATLLGFGLMLGVYSTRSRPDPKVPWSSGMLVIGPDPTDAPVPTGSIHPIPARLRLLTGNAQAEAILQTFAKTAPGGLKNLEAQLRPPLIAVAFDQAGLDARALASGRLPVANGDEVLAGGLVPEKTRLTLDSRTLKVVGVLKPDSILLADAYLLPDAPAADGLFPPKDPSVHHAMLVRDTPAQARDRKALRQFEKRFPSSKYVKLTPRERLAPGTYCAYLAGQAILLVGGSGVLIGLYRRLADRVPFRPLASPLHEIARRPRLIWGVHLVYFGLVTAGSLLIYGLPEVQTVLVAAVRDQIGSSKGPLGIAGDAYGSGNILRAAAVTFLVNYVLGSLACVTLPSIVLPGLGCLLAMFRAFLWGFLLAPTLAGMAGPMLPHSWTMLLEGEGYILAAFFGLLVPIRLFETSLGGSLPSRFGRAVILNLQAALLIAVVLAVAALYEATEVILMAG